MNRLSKLLIVAVIAALCTATAWQVGRINWMMIQLSFADEQTKVFTEMSAQAIEALKKQPPDVQAAVEFLEYTHGYYPSGTKQAHDTTLDRIVERSRSSAESRIIETLRAATGLDHGDKAEDWIRELRDPHLVSSGTAQAIR